jgi:hypothetical protein
MAKNIPILLNVYWYIYVVSYINFKQKMVKRLILIISVISNILVAQTSYTPEYSITPEGNYMIPCYVDEKGDTILYIDLREITVTCPAVFKDPADYNRYLLYRRYAPIVAPYAIAAAKAYRELENANRDKSKKDRSKYIDALNDKVQDQFSGPLKKLTRTQGYLLIKMIERELHMPFYDLVKDVKGTFSAMYWNQFSKIYGYQLKDGYEVGKDPVLDAVLQDFDLAYSMK